MDFFLKGLLLGLAIAAPVGPIGLLTIRRTLAQGWAAGFATGLGAACADAAYGAVAAFGLSAVSALLVAQKSWLTWAGGLFLLWLGIRTWFAPPGAAPKSADAADLVRAWSSSLVLTLTNPATILSFVAVFAGLGLGAADSRPGAVGLVAGVFVGSALWWLFLSALIARLHHQLQTAHLRFINRVSGILLAAFGVAALLL